MQDALARARTVADSFAFLLSYDHHVLGCTDDAAGPDKAVCFSMVALAASCGVLVGWHGRGWCMHHRSTSYVRRESRQRNPLWLLPAPSVSTVASISNWVAACVGQQRVPRFVWSPPLLQHCLVTYPAGSAERDAAARAQLDAARWGTRVLNRLQGPHHPVLTSKACVSLVSKTDTQSAASSRLVSAFRTRIFAASFTSAAWAASIPLRWQPLPSYAVNVFYMKGGAPSTTAPASASPLCTPLRVLQRQTFALLYDPTTRLSLWCGYHLTRSGAERARQQRRCLTVCTDRSLERSARRVPAEVQRRGYDRGHLAPHASVASTLQSAMEATLLTNIHLQQRAINRGVWRWLEAATRAYVRTPYLYEVLTDAGAMPANALHVRKDGLLLARLLAQRTPFASVTDTQRMIRRASRRGGEMESRHLCVNVGPLYYASSAFSCTTSEHKPQALEERDSKCIGGAQRVVHRSRAGRRLRHRKHPSVRWRSNEKQSRRYCTGSSSAAAAPQERTALVPDAFFLSLWDALTHHHLHLVIPNTSETPGMLALTQALAAATRQVRQQQRRRCGQQRIHAHLKLTQVGRSPSVMMPAEDNYKALEAALAAFIVSTERLEQLFAESLVEVRMRWAACQSRLLPSDHAGSASGSDLRFPSPTLALRTPLRFFPVYHERWLWHTRWHRLAHRTLPKMLCLKRRRERVSASATR
ncbi:DNA/RNA non-specific endonuclease-like protein [Leptomonas seymouri]|uniref:DNA/RNA non-specific endonuclease-like protein n=1 Tax=Leptomonas seymouri TaxID=5684 RepID=A0A0N0P888_LEPSE|nr:DNA/RNA non-specific endonuclease-like protein [Leptomonas seymouri]|eukprot:KPI89666.1 DNA/RNA non-specific endonuclease-like protein [Leptomonas seymouri]